MFSVFSVALLRTILNPYETCGARLIIKIICSHVRWQDLRCRARCAGSASRSRGLHPSRSWTCHRTLMHTHIHHTHKYTHTHTDAHTHRKTHTHARTSARAHRHTHRGILKDPPSIAHAHARTDTLRYTHTRARRTHTCAHQCTPISERTATFSTPKATPLPIPTPIPNPTPTSIFTPAPAPAPKCSNSAEKSTSTAACI